MFLGFLQERCWYAVGVGALVCHYIAIYFPLENSAFNDDNCGEGGVSAIRFILPVCWLLSSYCAFYDFRESFKRFSFQPLSDTSHWLILCGRPFSPNVGVRHNSSYSISLFFLTIFIIVLFLLSIRHRCMIPSLWFVSYLVNSFLGEHFASLLYLW